MNIPNFIDRRTLAKMAATGETHCVRVILQKVSNSAPYTVRSRLRRYLFERDGIAGCHVLDIPVSVWMAGTPSTGPYRSNPSIASDLQPTMQLPFTIQVIPWVAKQAPSPVVVIDQTPIEPPIEPPIDEAPQGEDSPPINEPAAEVQESPAAARMRKMRETKAAKRTETTD